MTTDADEPPFCLFCLEPLDACRCDGRDVCERCGGDHGERDCQRPCPNCGEVVCDGCDGWAAEIEF